MRALDIKDTRDYIPECDRNLPENEQTVFVLKTLSAKDQAIVDDKTGSVDAEGGYKITVGTQNLLLIHLGLVDVRNFKDSNGNDVKLTRSDKLINGIHEISNDFIIRIPKDIRSEIAYAIRKGYQLEDEEVKN